MVIKFHKYIFVKNVSYRKALTILYQNDFFLKTLRDNLCTKALKNDGDLPKDSKPKIARKITPSKKKDIKNVKAPWEEVQQIEPITSEKTSDEFGGLVEIFADSNYNSDIIDKTPSSDVVIEYGSLNKEKVENEQPFVRVIKAPTGGGKTYEMARKAIVDAIAGKIAVICFPNLNLLNSNFNDLNSILKQEYPHSNISLLKINLNSPDSEIELFSKKLMRGRCIILTLHAYIIQRGDYFAFSTFYQMLQPFKAITSIYIDEGHLYFETYKRNFKLMTPYMFEKNTWIPIKNSRDFKNAIQNNKQIKISKPSLKMEKETIGSLQIYNLVEDTSPELPNELSILSQDKINEQFDNSINFFSQKSEPEPNKLQNQIEKAKTSNELTFFKSEIQSGKMFPELQSIEILTDGDDLNKLELPFYRVFPLSITGNLEKDRIIKNFLINKYLQIFNFNAFLTVANQYDLPLASRLYNYVRNYQESGYFPSAIEVANHVNHCCEVFIDKFKNDYSLVDESSDQQIQKVYETIKELGHDFTQIFTLKPQLKQIEPETLKSAFTLSTMVSQNTFIVFYNAIERNSKRKILNFEELKNSIKKESKESKESKEPNENLLSLDENDEELKTDNIKENIKEKPLIIDMIKELPFTTQMTSSNILDFLILAKFNQTNIASATYSFVTISPILASIENLRWIQLSSNQPKLDKIILLKSNLDWFTQHSEDHQEAWADFGSFFYENFSKGNESLEGRKFGLLLAPDNRTAEGFYTHGIKNEGKKFFTLIKASTEESELKESKTFEVAPDLGSEMSFRIGSTLSTISVGLNMPQHVFIIAAANTYKPLSTIWQYGDIGTKDARNYEIANSLIQAIGRCARRTELEKKTQSPTIRMALISKSDVFPTSVRVLGSYSQKFYKNVKILDLSEFDNLVSKIIRPKILNLELSYKFKKDSILFNKINSLEHIRNKDDFRFSLLKELMGNLKFLDFDDAPILTKYKLFLKTYQPHSLFLKLNDDLAEIIKAYLETNDKNYGNLHAQIYLLGVSKGSKNQKKQKKLTNEASIDSPQICLTVSDVTRKYHYNRWDSLQKKQAELGIEQYINFINNYFQKITKNPNINNFQIQSKKFKDEFDKILPEDIHIYLFKKIFEEFLIDSFSLLENLENEDLKKQKDIETG